MRILLLIKSEHPSISGADQMAIQTAELLAQQYNCNITLAYHSRELEAGKQWVEKCVHHIVVQSEKKDAKAQILLNVSFDMIHLIDFVSKDFLELGIELKSCMEVPLVVTPATDYSLWECVKTGKMILKAADAVIALHEPEMRFFQELIPSVAERTFIVKHGINIPHIKKSNFRELYGIPMDAPIVLFIGRKLSTKGYEYILKAAPFIWREVPLTHFVFAGPDTADSRKRFNNLKEEGRIINLGFIMEEIKQAVLAACDIFCLPSTVDVFPLVFLEAWSYQKPVVASQSKGIEEVVRHEKDGLVTNPDERHVAEVILHLIKRRDERTRLGLNGRKKVEQEHSWKTIANQILDIYRGCISKKERMT